MKNAKARLYVLVIWISILSILGYKCFVDVENTLFQIRFKTPKDILDGNP